MGALPVVMGDIGDVPSNTWYLESDANIDIRTSMGHQFILNQGQIRSEDVVFHTDNAYFTPTGMINRVSEHVDRVGPTMFGQDLDNGRIHIYTVDFQGARPVVPRGRDILPHYSNFFLGNDPSAWATGVPSFGEIVYEDLYDNIDLVFRTVPQGIKYEFVVRPGGAVNDIRMRYSGATLRTDGVDLLIETPLGTIIDGDLNVYQDGPNGPSKVPAALVVEGGSVRYDIDHDPAIPLVIDPLIYSTYLGSNKDEVGRTVKVDHDGNAYVAGQTDSLQFPVTNGTYDKYSNGGVDAFLTKIGPDGENLIFSTYLGGSSGDDARSIEIDGKNDIYIVGDTNSTNFPVTLNAFCSTKNPNFDNFILKLSSTGENLVYSTFFGGSSQDRVFAVSVDDLGSAYFLGFTESDDLPVTAGAFCSTYNGDRDMYVAKIDPAGSNIQYVNYLGGSAREVDFGSSREMMALDQANNLYVVGYTLSSDFPTTPGAYNDTFHGGNNNMIILKLDPTGSNLVYSAFISGSGFDVPFAIAIDDSDAAYVSGATNSTDFPTTSGAYQGTLRGGIDSFVLKLSPDGSQLDFSTFIGGSQNDYAESMVLDGANNPYLAGISNSNDFPVTSDAFNNNIRGNYDVILYALTPAGDELQYSTFIGGSSDEEGLAIDVDRWDNAYVTGYTKSFNFPVTEGTFDDSHNGGPFDGFVLKLGNMVNSITTPKAPQNLTATPGDGFIILGWDPPKDDGGVPVKNYTVYSGMTETTLAPLITVDTITIFNDSSVTNGVRYFYGVSAISEVGEGPSTGTVNATPGTVPTEPLNLTAVVGDGTVNLSWLQPSDDKGFPITDHKVYRGTDPLSLSSFAFIPPVLEYNDTTVVNGVTYYYYVTAYNSKGEGLPSLMVNATPWSLPTEPFNLTATAGPESVILGWEPPEDDGGFEIITYNIFKGTSIDDLLPLTSVPGSDYNDTNLVNGVMYYYKVSAENQWGEGPLSNLALATPSDVPDAPVLAAKSLDRVELSWTVPNSNGFDIIDYSIYRGTEITDLKFLESTSDTRYIDVTGILHEIYYYSVAAINPMGEGPLSNVVKAAAGGIGPYVPSPPVWELAVPGDGYVFLSWSVPDQRFTPSPSSFNLLKGDGPENLTLLVVLMDASFNDTNVTNGETYFYKVRAINSVGEGNLSEVIEATPTAIPGIPTDLALNARPRKVEISWNAPLDDGGSEIIEFRIYRGPSKDKMTRISQTRRTTYTDGSLEPGTVYYYSVSAVNENGEGTAVWGKTTTLTEPTITGVDSFLPWIILAMIALVVTIFLFLNIRRHKAIEDGRSDKMDEGPDEDEYPQPPEDDVEKDDRSDDVEKESVGPEEEDMMDEIDKDEVTSSPE